RVAVKRSLVDVDDDVRGPLLGNRVVGEREARNEEESSGGGEDDVRVHDDALHEHTMCHMKVAENEAIRDRARAPSCTRCGAFLAATFAGCENARMTFRAALFLLIATASCAPTIGASAVPEVHASYNDALVRSQNAQLLLNLVRMRYRDTPYFVDVTSVTN